MSRVRATQSFAAGTKAADRMITGGEILDESDPVAKQFPEFFERLVEVIPEPIPAKRISRKPGGKADG